jgi:hypothetical protein
MTVHNRYVSRLVHRIFNGILGAALTASAGVGGLHVFDMTSALWNLSWWILYAAPIVLIALPFLNPDRFSVVNGVAGHSGYDELR